MLTPKSHWQNNDLIIDRHPFTERRHLFRLVAQTLRTMPCGNYGPERSHDSMTADERRALSSWTIRRFRRFPEDFGPFDSRRYGSDRFARILSVKGRLASQP